MDAIFLCEKKDTCRKVYADALASLRAVAGVDDVVCDKADVLKDPARYADTRIIFSTWGMPAFTEEEIRAVFPRLECVFYAAGTVKGFARPFLDCGVRVFSAWAANAVPVAEMTVAEIVLANKGYFLTSRVFHESGRKAGKKALEKCRGNYGETVGIIGAGMIGKLVIRMLKAYKLNVLVFDPFLPDDVASSLGVEKCDLPSLFERAFVVSNHLANKEETRGILTYDHFRRMRDGAVFINTGRGAQVVEDDLVRVLRERPDLTALLDVTDPEPPDEGHPFYTLPNCRLTPHIAGSAGDEVRRMGLYMLDEYRLWRDGGKCLYEVTIPMLATMA